MATLIRQGRDGLAEPRRDLIRQLQGKPLSNARGSLNFLRHLSETDQPLRGSPCWFDGELSGSG